MSRKFATVDGGENFFVTPQTWLGSARNFAKTRFKRFQTFQLSTPTKICLAKISDRKFDFSPIWCGFGGATAERTSKSACPSNFALDRLFQRSARPKNVGFGKNLGSQQKFSPDHRCLVFWRTFCKRPIEQMLQKIGVRRSLAGTSPKPLRSRRSRAKGSPKPRQSLLEPRRHLPVRRNIPEASPKPHRDVAEIRNFAEISPKTFFYHQ